jgi:hypothetical protein
VYAVALAAQAAEQESKRTDGEISSVEMKESFMNTIEN